MLSRYTTDELYRVIALLDRFEDQPKIPLTQREEEVLSYLLSAYTLQA